MLAHVCKASAGELRQEDSCAFEANMGYKVSSRAVLPTQWDPVSKTTTKQAYVSTSRKPWAGSLVREEKDPT